MDFAEVTKQRINLLRAGICLLVLVIAAVSWAGYRTVQDFHTSIDLVTHTYEVLASLESTLATIEDAETGTRDFLLTKKREYLEPYERATERLEAELQQLRSLTRNDPWQQAQVVQLKELTDKLAKLAKKPIEARSKSLAAALRVVRTGEAKGIRQDIRDLMAGMRRHERGLLSVRQKGASFRMRMNTICCGILLAADIGFLVWIGILSFRLNHLHRVIRVCAWTKKVQHEGQWITLEEYLEKTMNAPVSHGICAEAAATMIADVNGQAENLTSKSAA